MINFDQMIDNHLHKENRPKEIGRYYPSEIGTCMRKVWYSYKFPMETNPELLKVFELGNILHDFVVKVLKSEKNPDVELIKTELPFRQEIEDFLVSGRIDNIILIKASGKNILVEVKSTGNIDFVEEAMHHNKIQLQLYMHVTGIHNGILLYVDKRNLKSKVFPVNYNEEDALKIIDRFKVLNKLLKTDALPDPEARSGKESLWMCRYCEYRDKCYKEDPSSPRWL
ncbi:MAG TPA: Dna2/Cas4 domain-containing protein [Candidatus Aenigmarchaeota archaeon]|nr:Dna2/Cas4 domain-containing protein [Candidatus Aenigmarchaeota archaeon]